MLLNLMWLFSGSGLALIGSLILSSHLSIEQFGVVTGLFSFTTLLSAICSRGQQGVILSQSPGVRKETLRKAIRKVAPLILLSSIGFLINDLLTNNIKSSFLLTLIPFVILGTLIQIVIGTNQANNKPAYLGLYQSLPSLARSIPAILLFITFLYTGSDITINNYFNTTLAVTSITLALTSVILAKEYSKADIKPSANDSEPKSETHYWATSVLSSSYVSLIAPIILFLWGDLSAGIFGIYILFWNVTNIIISSIYNNSLLPRYAKVRADPVQSQKIIHDSLKITIMTSCAIAITCICLFYFCISFIWPPEYKEHQIFFLLALTSLVIRPFSARLGLPYNFSNLIRCKTKIQIVSLLVLVIGSALLSLTHNHNLLAATIVLSELVVLILYAHNNK